VLWQNLILDRRWEAETVESKFQHPTGNASLSRFQHFLQEYRNVFFLPQQPFRKSYRFYQGGALSDNSTKPSAWNDDEIVRRLNVWLEHHSIDWYPAFLHN
jgi:hypothetical protein